MSQPSMQDSNMLFLELLKKLKQRKSQLHKGQTTDKQLES